MDNFPHLPTIALVAAAVVAVVIIANRWVFGPLNVILARRQTEIDEAGEAFADATRIQEERLAEVEARVAQARKEAYAIREAAHGEARAERDRVLGEARAEAARKVEEAKAAIDEQIEQARLQLEADAGDLAKRIADRILSRPVGSGGNES
ncbi:MAG TPA: ATP synthase F0 subunit B [Acidobacteriota bacterium]|jgi:F-type H+-transporting ATPase subunit b|nr:ATP synthase F0 subunit B [Acidobacteriota bacterium]